MTCEKSEVIVHQYVIDISLESTFILLMYYDEDGFLLQWGRYFCLHWLKKAISLQGKHKGNHIETTSLQQMSIGVPSWKLPFSMWFPSRGNTLRSGLHASIAWKLESTSGLHHMEDRGKLHGNPRFPKGNTRETTRELRFPDVKVRETTWKPQVSLSNQRATTWKPQISHKFP